MIGPEKAPISPEKAPISPEKARFSSKDFPPISSEKSGLEPHPKDPAVLKTVRDSELLRRSVFTTPPRFTTP